MDHCPPSTLTSEKLPGGQGFHAAPCSSSFVFARKIVSLCDFTGTWASPYLAAGYDVELVDVKHGKDARMVEYGEIHGILAAPPCTHFTVSGAQYWPEKDKDGRTLEAISIVDACVRLAAMTNPAWWVLENPIGRITRWLGPPRFAFDPCDFGGWMEDGERSHASYPERDAYTKKTYLWGNFRIPEMKPVKPIANDQQQNNISSPRDENGKLLPWNSDEAKTIRSITPLGFARAFAAANP